MTNTLADKGLKKVSGDLTAGAQHAKMASWQNTTGGAILVPLILVSITTPATAAAKINAGQAATEIESDDMIDGAAINAAGTPNSIINAGTNGKGAQYVADDEWITFFEDNSAASTDLVGKYYIFYTKA